MKDFTLILSTTLGLVASISAILLGVGGAEEDNASKLAQSIISGLAAIYLWLVVYTLTWY